MNPSTSSQAELHQAIQALLPWFVADSLSTPEKTLVQQHLASCPQCQSELEWQQTLRDNEPPAPAMPNVDAAFAKLLPRLTEPPALAVQASPSKALPAPSLLARLQAWLQNQLKNKLQSKPQNKPQNKPQRGWVMAAMAGQAVVIVGLALGLVFQVSEQNSQVNLYRALSANAGHASERPVDGDIAVTFKPTASIQEIQNSLHANGARIIDGPTIADVYILSVPAERQQQVVAALRAQAHIASVASLKAGGIE